ncbi:prolipoprotein diacylglyceryl transferase [bacterium]|nr:prolipoprotein diacylglyceryl transferase [bacterium]
MIENLFFITGLGGFLFFLSIWGFKFLPKEKWQVLGTIPIAKTPDGNWSGLNLTYYGFFNGIAATIAVAIVLILLGAAYIPFSAGILFVLGILVFAAPSAKIIARLVEKKPCTLSIGAASFVGIILAPWIAVGVQTLFARLQLPNIEIMVLMAAISTGYAFGEGIGRLSCISFGCCYGKPVSQLPRYLQFIFRHANFVFLGKTKKIAYAHALDEKEILPIQGITSIIYFISGLTGTFLFLQGSFRASFLITLATTQLWRIVSEFLRADFRGEGKLSVYQYMAILSVIYSVGISLLFYDIPVLSTSISQGLSLMWNLPVILFLQALWLAVFISTGRSKVISAELSFHVKMENI